MTKYAPRNPSLLGQIHYSFSERVGFIGAYSKHIVNAPHIFPLS
jgi:hypothetical protein